MGSISDKIQSISNPAGSISKEAGSVIYPPTGAISTDGSGTSNANILLETGFDILLEDGGYILLENAA